jgi:UDP-N-acetylmuramate--alanine ligase
VNQADRHRQQRRLDGRSGGAHPERTAPGEQETMHIHMVGIGGAGMSALARLYLEQGHTVSGSDESDSQALRDLAALGATVYVGHEATNVDGADMVVTTSAAPAGNPELVAAGLRGLPVFKHAQALGELFNRQRGIAVAGTHGKTTTSAMVAYGLTRAGIDPKFQVGGVLVDLDTSAHWGSGAWMVVEADEFDRRFLQYRPEIAVVTNVEPDHFEYFESVAAMEGAFLAFLRQVAPGGAVVACAHERRLATLLDQVPEQRTVRYGIVGPGESPDASMDWWASEVVFEPGGSRSTVSHRRSGGGGDGRPEVADVALRLQLPGRHNLLNALAAIATGDLVGVPAPVVAGALADFRGTQRRFQLAGAAGGVRVYEDYAHHPTEVRVNLEAARLRLGAGDRLWAVFQPHLHQRTEGLFDEFARAFDAADRVILTDVYSPTGREPVGAYRGSAELVQAMGHGGARHVSDAAAARAVLLAELRAGDVVVVMGAGPINALAWQLAGDLRASGAPA